MIRIEKHRHLIDFALSSLMRRWRKNAAVLVLYTLVVFILASVVFFTHAVSREAKLVLQGSPAIVVQRLIAGRHDLMPSDYIHRMRSVTGASDVRGRLWAYYFDPSTGANYTVIAADSPSLREGDITIGQGVARALGVRKGDLAAFRSRDGTYRSFEVKSLFSTASELVSTDLIIMPEKDFRDLFGIPRASYTDAVLNVRNALEERVVSAKILRMLPDTRTIRKDEILRTYDAVFAWRSGLMLAVFSGAFLSFLIFAWDKASSLSIDERKEIGVLKALGWDTGEVIALKAWEGIIISLSSFLAGIILAYFHVFFAYTAFFEPVLKGWAVIYPHFRLTPAIDACHVAALLFLTVIPYTAATVIPSWLAAIIDPDSAMRL